MLPFMSVLPWRVSAANMIASLISSSVAPKVRASAVSA